MKHIPVMLNETLQHLNIKSDGIYVDCTLGGGGHSLAIAEKLSAAGTLIGLDYDGKSLESVRDLFGKFPCRKIMIQANFKDLKKILNQNNLPGVDGILADLGYSSLQLENPDYGLSWKNDEAALDMRLDGSAKSSNASEIINRYPENKLIALFQNYGEVRATKKLVRLLLEASRKTPLQTIGDLKTVIRNTFKSIPGVQYEKIYNQVFQALRIEVNQELENLQKLLQQIPECLNSNGRAVVISFHSLEDRLVKQAFRSYPKFEILTKKPIEASPQEQSQNPRSKSAKLRAIQK